MPTTLSGNLLTNYRTTSKYSEVFKYPPSLDAGFQLAAYFLLDDFLILVEENSASRKLIIVNITNSTRVLTKDLTTFQNPLYLLDPVEKTLAILAKPNIVATLKLTNGVWGDLKTLTLASDLPEYTADPIFRLNRVFIPSGSNLVVVDVTRPDGAVVTKTFSNTDQITAIEVDLRENNFYMAGRNIAIIYRYDLNSVITAAALNQVGSFRLRADKRPAYLNTITNLFLGHQGRNLVSSFNDGSVYKFNTSDHSSKVIMSVLGDVRYLNGIKDQYSVIATSDLEVKLYDFSKNEEIQLEHNSHDPLKALDPFITSQFLLLGDKTGSISFYKLEEIPILKINYVRLEAKEPTLRYLDINAEVQSDNPNIKIAAPVEVKLEYRGGVAVKTFQETGQKRNFYVPLTEYTNILKESSLFLGNGLISYTLTSLVSGVKVRDTYDLSSLDQQALTDENIVLQGKLSKFYLKDMYSAEDALYFKMMYLSQTANSLLLTFNNTEKILFTKENENIARFYHQYISNEDYVVLPKLAGNDNLIISSESQYGYINENGEISSGYTTYFTTNLIKCTPDDSFTVTVPAKSSDDSSLYYRIIKYDAHKNFLSREVKSYQNTSSSYTFKPEPTVSYFAISFDGTYGQPYKIERGTTATAWKLSEQDRRNPNLFEKVNSEYKFISVYSEELKVEDPKEPNNTLTSAFIPVKKLEPYYLQGWVTVPANGYPWHRYQYYNKNKRKVGNIYYFESQESLPGIQHYAEKIVVPDNDEIAYIRFSAREYTDGRFKFEKGITPTPYNMSSLDKQLQLKTVIKGRNYLNGTSSEYQTLTRDTVGYILGAIGKTDNSDWNKFLEPLIDKLVTISAYIKNTTPYPVRIQVWTNTESIYGNYIQAGGEGYSYATGILKKGFTSSNVAIIQGGGTSLPPASIQYKEASLIITESQYEWAPGLDKQVLIDVTSHNILPNSKTFNGTNISSAATLLNLTYNGCAVRYYKYNPNNKNFRMAQFTNCVKPKLNEEFTVSFWAKGTGEMRIFFYGENGYLGVDSGSTSWDETVTRNDGLFKLKLTDSWRRYWIKYKLKAAPESATTVYKHLLFSLDDTNPNIEAYLAGVQFERGTEVHDYSPLEIYPDPPVWQPSYSDLGINLSTVSDSLTSCKNLITFKDKNLITNIKEDWAQNYIVVNDGVVNEADHTFDRMNSDTRISTKDFIQLKPSTTYKLSVNRLTKNNIYYKMTLSTVADYRVPNSRLDEDVWIKNSSFNIFTTPATCKYGIISLGSDTPLTTSALGRDVEVTLEEYDDYKEVAPVDKYHLFKLPHVTSPLTSNKIPLKVDLIENGVVRETISTTKEVTPKYAYKDIKYSTSDGDLRYQDELLLTELEQGPKTEFLKDNTYTPTIIPISKHDIKLTDDSKLGNIISGEGEVGYLSFPIRSDYAKHLYKSDTLVMDIYINGYRLPRTNSQQQYNLETGALRVDYPVRDLQKILTNQQLNDLFNKNVSDAACGVTMIAVVRRKSLISTELLLCSYTVSDTYQNDIEALQGNGIYIPFKTNHNNLTQAQLRLFIRNKGDNLISRYNPSNYTLTLDLKNKQILVQLLGTTNLGIGSELIIVDSGYLTNTVKYVNTNTTYRMDSLPLVYFDSDNNIYNGLTAKAEDLDVMVNGLTLIPMKDYTVIEPTLINTPTMLIFKNYIPVGSTVEVNYLPENCQRVVTWSKPAVGTTNKFSLDDEKNVFVKGTFETFVNNLKIDEAKVEVLNNRTIAINVTNPRNVMVRFSNKPHSNLKLIEDACKFNTIDINDNNYHSSIGDSELSLFDTTSLGRSTDIGKVALYDLLEAERNNHQQNEPIILDCNESSTLLTDIYLDSKYIENQYLTRDLIIDANEVSLPNQKPDIINPNI